MTRVLFVFLIAAFFPKLCSAELVFEFEQVGSDVELSVSGNLDVTGFIVSTDVGLSGSDSNFINTNVFTTQMFLGDSNPTDTGVIIQPFFISEPFEMFNELEVLTTGSVTSGHNNSFIAWDFVGRFLVLDEAGFDGPFAEDPNSQTEIWTPENYTVTFTNSTISGMGLDLTSDRIWQFDPALEGSTDRIVFREKDSGQTAVPEPSSLLMLGMVSSIGLFHRRKCLA